MYTYKIEQAIKAAALLHQDQLRKGDQNLPYITHLMAVTVILRDYTKDEDALVAALLHDTIEDTDYTMEELETDFGKNVAKIVATVTEPDNTGDKKIPWVDVKKTYARQIKNGPIEAVMVAAADKIHNFRSIVETYYEDHDGFLRDFGTDLDSRLEAYQAIANAINNRLADGIVHEFNHTFEQYKNFIFDVKETIS
ncbi:bifunctional (p)ppGpp synthetase/guanosine-3',5'-bis(diphosphate) 3'-pyrophosphohydrolase [Candidatus Kaiserbacteria bacterium]|nr:bifunctional (p)ppGpp synthetase/guanosine-3',5'-bis(diphosphate) 3'-pyrophosphohydrolase [Candidatus Kaiserbacteria bacterium]